MVSHCISLTISDLEHFLRVYCIFSLEKYLLKTFVDFFNWVVCIFVVEV